MRDRLIRAFYLGARYHAIYQLAKLTAAVGVHEVNQLIFG